jgi:hypothetical protein
LHFTLCLQLKIFPLSLGAMNGDLLVVRIEERTHGVMSGNLHHVNHAGFHPLGIDFRAVLMRGEVALGGPQTIM